MYISNLCKSPVFPPGDRAEYLRTGYVATQYQLQGLDYEGEVERVGGRAIVGYLRFSLVINLKLVRTPLPGWPACRNENQQNPSETCYIRANLPVETAYSNATIMLE